MVSSEIHLSDSARALAYFENYQPQFEKLMDLLDIDVKVDDLEAMVDATQLWVKGDHSRPVNKIKPDEKLGQDMWAVFTEMGMLSRHALPALDYDELLVPGAIHRGNRNRLTFLKEVVTNEGVNPSRITLLGGERLVYPEIETVDIERSEAQIIEQTPNEPWWIQVSSGQTDIIWETDLLRLQGLATLELRPISPDKPTGDDPYRPHTRMFRWGVRKVMLMHTPKVVRPQGEPRHTTEACLVDWLDTTEPAEDSLVALVAACPHIDRLGMTSRRILRQQGREDINLVVGGSGAQVSVNHNHCLGEIGRSLFEVQLALAA